MKIFITSIILVLASFSIATAQTDRKQFSVLFGLNQPVVLHGFNFEVDYWTKKFVFDYSHGMGLNVTGKMVSSDYENQKLNFKITHSLGFGVGYRINKAFNLRFEPKMHIYETYYDGQQQRKSNSVANFTTYTLGVGAYYLWQPFKKNGISVVPSVRYWYKVGSTLKEETFKAPNIGFANTPFLVNISIGYTF